MMQKLHAKYLRQHLGLRHKQPINRVKSFKPELKVRTEQKS